MSVIHASRRPYLRLCALILCALLLLPAGSRALYGDEPTITAKGVILIEQTTGETLFEQNADDRLYPASTTKIMTALLLLEYGHLNDVVTASREAITTVPRGSSHVGLKIGEQMTLYDLLICMLVPSGNDAANVIAEAVGGTIPDFVYKMNQRAKELGCSDTNFENTHGFHDDNHYTTARDLLKITLAAMQYPLFTEISGMVQATVPATNISDERIFNSTNYMISATNTSAYLYAYCTGGKTGSTTPAGVCLVAFAQKDDLRLVSVLLGAETTYTHSGIRQIRSYMDTKKLFVWAFRSFSFRTVLTTSTPVAEVPVALADKRDFVVVRPEHAVSKLVHRSVPDDAFSLKVTLAEDVTAPVDRDELLGSVTVYFKDRPIDTVALRASTAVERSQTLYWLEQMAAFFKRPWVWYALLGLFLLIALYIVFMILHNRKVQKKVQRRRRHSNIRR